MENQINEMLELNLEQMQAAAGGKDYPPEFYTYRDYVASLFEKYGVSWGNWRELRPKMTAEELSRLRELEGLLRDAEERRK